MQQYKSLFHSGFEYRQKIDEIQPNQPSSFHLLFRNDLLLLNKAKSFSPCDNCHINRAPNSSDTYSKVLSPNSGSKKEDSQINTILQCHSLDGNR